MREMDEWEKGWLAGITDGDGYWRMTKRRFWSKLLNDWRYRYTFGLTVATTTPSISERCYEITEVGNLKWIKSSNGIKDLLRWRVGVKDLRELIPEILPYCVKSTPEIVLEGITITGLPRISMEGVQGGYMRQPKYTTRLDELHHLFLEARVRDAQESIYANIKNPRLSPNCLELRDLR